METLDSLIQANWARTTLTTQELVPLWSHGPENLTGRPDGVSPLKYLDVNLNQLDVTHGSFTNEVLGTNQGKGH